MSRRVILTAAAETELESAYCWYVEHAPESGHFVAQVHQLIYGCRRKTHRALFTIRPDEVVVLRIRHVAQAPLSELE